MIKPAVKSVILSLLPLLAYSQQTASLEHGRAVYRSNCAFCHGLDGRGGRGPNLVSAPLNHGDSDEAIAKVIRNGVPGSTMPAFSGMDAQELKDVTAYLHQMSGGAQRIRPKVGDAAAGKAVYDRSGCAACHRVNWQGSTYGPDLSRVGVARSLEYLRESLLKPSSDIPPEYEGITVVTAKDRVSGIRVNEDTFSIQLRTPSEQFRSFLKKDVRQVVNEPKSLMPSYSHLSGTDLNNLLEYLMSLRGHAAGDVKQAEGIR
jgi:cytochrome c oxidase cbb3-type subunit III